MLCFRATFLVLLAVSVAVPTGYAGVFQLEVVDQANQQIPCRVLLLQGDGSSFLPSDLPSLYIGSQKWFVIDGSESLDIPSGRYTLRVERGMEYTRYKRRLRVNDGINTLQVKLNHWADLRRLGYASGENHIHVPLAQLGPLLAAENLDFGTTLSWWNGTRPNYPVPQGVEHQRQVGFGEHRITATVFDAEIEHAWGAAYIQNLPASLPIPSEPARPNLDSLRHAIEAGAIVHYQAGWSREVGLDALLGKVHTVNVCNNNFHQHQYQLRSNYSNLLQVPGFEVYQNTELGMFRMNMETYYRLLNWGLKIAVGAGSATGVKPAPVGYNRTYVRTEPKGTIEDFYRNWKAGRNFVTNGPLLFLKAEEQIRPGDSIEMKKSGGEVKLNVSVKSRQPLTSVEIILNGVVAHIFELDDVHQFNGITSIPIKKGCWIAARCTSNDRWLSDEELAPFSRGKVTDRFPTRPSRLRFAHTSPIYVNVGGKGAAVPKSIREGMRMMEQLKRFAKENADAGYLASTLEAIDEAKSILAEKLSQN